MRMSPAPEGPRVLFLASGLDSASFRFRVLQYLPYLRERGAHVVCADLAAAPGERRRLFADAASGAYDAVVVHRALLRWPDYLRLRRSVADYVFDFDDAILFRDSARRNPHSWQRRMRFRRMVGGARRVIAGNAYLADLAARYAAPHRVTVIPTTVDPGEYPAAEEDGGPAEPIIGWIGTRSNLMYLEAVAPALARVARRGGPRPRLKLVCDGFVDVPGIEVIRKPWSRRDEAADLRSFQVGIMPLPDDPWTRGKCACKILQYFAAGVPVVCSPVGANAEVVEEGRNGYFARTEDEWASRIEALLADGEKRRRFGKAGWETVEKRYSVRANLDGFLAALA